MELIVVVIALALIFDFINGFHDAANSIATVVSTKVLSPFQAVLWAGLFNFVAFFIFKDHGVANTISKTVFEQYITLEVVLAGLIAAIAWNLLTWWLGIPSSSSHTLMGGFMGAAIAHAGFSAVNSEPVIKTASFILLAPLTGMIMAFIISVWFLNSFKKGPAMKVVSIAVMLGVVWLVTSSMEFKKDYSGGSSYSLVFDSKVDKEKLKKSLTFKDAKGNEVAPALSASKDESGHKDTTGTRYTVKTLYMKQKGAADVDTALTAAVTAAAGKTKVPFTISESHRITDSSPEAERWDISHLKSHYESYPMKVIFHGANFKWILLGMIAVVMAVFSLFLSNLNPARANIWFRRLQLVSSAAFSIGHGGNDAQKVMGIITAALIAAGKIGSIAEMPNWVPLACYGAIGLGTLSGGWKIVKTMGSRITKVNPFEGVAAETAGAVTLFLTEALKIPVSTTHTITGSIMGVGATKRLSAVRWGVTINLVWAWVLTIPVSAVVAMGVYHLIHLFK